MLRVSKRPFRTMFGWQAAWTSGATALAGWVAGLHGAVSAALGGGIGILGGLAFAWLAARSQAVTADGILVNALKAEAAKLVVLVALLGLVLAVYQNVVIVALIGSFLVSSLLFGFAFFVRDT